MANNNTAPATKVIVPCRISFANIWEPKSINGSDEKYSVSLLIPKDDKTTLVKIKKAIEAAKEAAKEKKWNGKIPANLKLPMHDGDIDRPDDENYAGHFFFNATSKDAPQIVVGERLIRYFSLPCKPTKANGGRTRNLPEHAPEDWKLFKSYCIQDVETERDIRRRLEKFPLMPQEWDYYHMDQRINDRGILIDKELVQQAIICNMAMSEEMTKRAYALTGLENPNSVSQLKGWLEERGIEVDSLGKKNVASLITDLDRHSADGEALDMMKLRLQMAKSSVKKYQAAERYICQDGRAHGLFQFSGANRTQRWAGRGIQLQNLPQNHIATLDEARELVKMGCFDMIEALYGNTPDILSQLIRTMLIPKDGCEFIVADFSAIEARVLAWLAGEQWRLDAFQRGEDIYCACHRADRQGI